MAARMDEHKKEHELLRTEIVDDAVTDEPTNEDAELTFADGKAVLDECDKRIAARMDEHEKEHELLRTEIAERATGLDHRIDQCEQDLSKLKSTNSEPTPEAEAEAEAEAAPVEVVAEPTPEPVRKRRRWL